MGTHKGDRLSFRQWLRYRRYLAALKTAERGWVPPRPLATMKAEARRAARLTGD